jgi:hypothetical protein
LFPAVGIFGALAVGGGAGAALGAVAGHAGAGMTRADLMTLGQSWTRARRGWWSCTRRTWPTGWPRA